MGEEETSAVVEHFGATLAFGAVVLLHGQLGVGKIAFVCGLARGLGVLSDEVSSLTFTIIQEYRGRVGMLFHVDLYRLDSSEVDDFGLDELIFGAGIVAIEWAERWRGRLVDVIEVTIDDRGEDRRTIRIRNALTLSA